MELMCRLAVHLKLVNLGKTSVFRRIMLKPPIRAVILAANDERRF